MRSLLCCLAVVLVFVATGKAQRDCVDTGDTCRENCLANGRYQWCGSCEYYLDCTSGSPVITPCPEGLVWNDNAGICADTSPTCIQCVIPAAKCNSTGPNCLNNCVGQIDGLYQWCGRCDYFLQCTGGATVITKCQDDTLFYDHNFRACVAVSGTCFDRPCAIPSGCQCLNGGTCHDNGDGTYWCECPPEYTGLFCESPNYVESCGTFLSKATYAAANGFTILCYLNSDQTPSGRPMPCNETLIGLPIWGNAAGIIADGGNFGCHISPYVTYGPDSTIACHNNYNQYTSLSGSGSGQEYKYLMVCIRYPYEGVDPVAKKR